jgi:ribonucleoside-diphosphate reductase beta chain
MEPILNKTNSRFSLFPILHNDIYILYQKSLASFWVPQEIDLSQDVHDWKNRLNDNERHFIKYILAFFANSDSVVNENLTLRFYNEIAIPEARAFFSVQCMMETIHQETYSLLIDTYISDANEKEKLFNAIDNIPCVGKKGDFMFKYIIFPLPFAERLLAFMCVEGIFFSGAFCAIYWLKTKNLLQGLTFSNELISRDEGMHVEHAILLYKKLINKPSEKRVYEIIEEAVKIELEFITEALPVSLLGMNNKMMGEYIKFVSDVLLVKLGYKKLYNVSNPFPFMEMISLEGKTNFFEKRVGEYQKAGVLATKEEMTFSLDTDF